MKGMMCLGGILAAALWVGSGLGLAQEKKEQPAGDPNAMPGPAHRQLAARAGEYTTVTKFWKPDDAPQESKGTAKIASAVDGRFIIEENSGMFFGQPIKGVRITGYNNATKEYEGCWTYSMSTSIMTLTGTSKDEGKTVEWKGSYTDGSGKQNLTVITQQIDDDHFRVELLTPEGKKGPRLETTYARKK